MNSWTDIVTTAVVGAERQAFNAGAAAAALQPLYAQLDAADREGALLHAAALTALHERAGRLPARVNAPLPAPALAEAWPRCSARAAARLRLLLQGEHAELLPEFLRALAQAQQRVPEELLPILLERGKTEEPLFEALSSVIGARGQWLAQQREEWRYVTGDADAQVVWETGTLAQRKTLLQRVRRADPARARELLRQTWEQDAPKDTAAFLALFAQGLSRDDEPLLEAALDHPRTVMRQAAANLLMMLPDSAFVARMWARAQQCVTLKRSVLGKLKIEITLPAEYDAAMKRDAVREIASNRPLSKPAWWLLEILRAVPPSRWASGAGSHAGATLEELLKATHRHEYRELLLEGWQNAAIVSGDTAWLERFYADAGRHGEAEWFFAALPLERQEALALDRLADAKAWQQDAPTLQGAIRCMQPVWREPFSRAVIERFCQHSQLHLGREDWHWRNVLAGLGCRLHPATLPQALAAFTRLAPQAAQRCSAFDALLNLLQFRHDMLQELQP